MAKKKTKKKDKEPKQKASFVKAKEEGKLGYRTPDHLRGSKFSGKGKKPPKGKFNPGTFKVQHKG